MAPFKDHFSAGSAGYAAYRPTYPDALIDFLAEASPGHDLALDCGCGSGQLSTLLTRRFAQVAATDASPQQIDAAEAHERVTYGVAPAERSGLPNRSVDLVTAAQAAHWFDLPAFYAEARRVARPEGVVALITYGTIETEAAVAPIVQHFYRTVVGPYWPPERRHVEEGYRTFDFPFEEVAAPPLAIEVSWSLDHMLGYIETWSAVRSARKALGQGPIDAFRHDLAAAWGDPTQYRPIRFPLSLRIGRVEP